MDLAAIWLSLVTNVFNLQALVMALITIGLITIMTGLHYLLVQRIRWTALIHGIEVFCILLSMLLLRQMYLLLNADIGVGWAYVTAQMTIMLFSLYTFRYWAINILNVLMPFFIYGQNIYLGNGISHLEVFLAMSLVLAGAVLYFSHHQNDIFNSAW